MSSLNLNRVPGDEEKPLQKILMGVIVSILAAMVSALLAFDMPTGKLIRTLFAGIFFGTLATIILMNKELDFFYKGTIIGLCAGFASTIWPHVREGVAEGSKRLFVIDMLQKLIKFLKGKDDDTLSNT